MTGSSDKEPALPRTAAEWLTFVGSAALLAVVFGAVIYLWLSSPGGPARFVLEREPVRSQDGRYVLPVRVTNAGGANAVRVRIEGRLAEERPVFTVDFLPQGATARILLVFSQDPSAADVTVVSYEEGT